MKDDIIKICVAIVMALSIFTLSFAFFGENYEFSFTLAAMSYWGVLIIMKIDSK